MNKAVQNCTILTHQLPPQLSPPLAMSQCFLSPACTSQYMLTASQEQSYLHSRKRFRRVSNIQMAETQKGIFSFRRQFDKTRYPLLGNDEEEPVLNTKSYKSAVGVTHSTSVSAMRDLCRNEKGKWHWPVNGADLVFPGIYLGDETTALCTRWDISLGRRSSTILAKIQLQ